ncbi:MAG: hypothetical protein M3R08_12505 [Bacteroidota bacterium]|nr:hypothetical protein [Bacteroidota bacterium]
MEERNRKYLERSIKGLPVHLPRQDHWEQINAALDLDDQLQLMIPELPIHEPSDLLWGRIESSLHPVGERSTGLRIIPLFKYTAAVAASLLFFFLGRHWFIEGNQDNMYVTITYSEEVAPPESDYISTDPRPYHQGLAFIEEHCGRLPEICETPDFAELRSRLTELDVHEQLLKEELDLYGEDPMLIQSQIKVNNRRAAITKELVQLIIS